MCDADSCLPPIAVFAAVAAVIAENGLGVLLAYGKFIGVFYVGLVILWGALIAASAVVLGMKDSMRLVRFVREPLVLAFSTASSEAAYPKTMSRLEEFGVPRAGLVRLSCPWATRSILMAR
jgi:Na+/H+-dicarboxylate symporter